MIPKQENVLEDVNFETMPSKTYKMDLETDRVVSTCDDLDAMKQAIYKILNTERYDCPIYSWNYGVELKDLFGKPVNFCVLEIERRIKEALMQDDRIESVYGFAFEFPKKGIIKAQFTVKTVKGMLTAEKEVAV